MDDDAPVVDPLALGLRPLGRLACRVLGVLLGSSGRKRDRQVLPVLLDRVPARHPQIRGQPGGLDELADDALGLLRASFARHVQEESRPVARDQHAPAEALPRAVVQVESAEPLADRVPVLVVVELDLDAKPVVHGRRRYQRARGGAGSPCASSHETTGLRRTPMRSISASITSPGLR